MLSLLHSLEGKLSRAPIVLCGVLNTLYLGYAASEFRFQLRHPLADPESWLGWVPSLASPGPLHFP